MRFLHPLELIVSHNYREFIMPKSKNENYIEPYYDDVIKEFPSDETFIIGQSYEKVSATTLSCKKCGSMMFNVGKSSCYTAIKCTNCSWQLCIHDG